MPAGNPVRDSLRATLKTFFHVIPIIIGMLLLSSLLVTLFQDEISAGLFGNGALVDTLFGGVIGSIAVGHPLASYIIGGELLGSGVRLSAVTALLVSWVTVGFLRLPAEAMFFGYRFAVYRNLIGYVSAVAIAFLTVTTLHILGIG